MKFAKRLYTFCPFFVMKFDVQKPYLFCDYGLGQFHVVRSDDLYKYKRLTRDQFVDLSKWVGNVRQLVIESAHLETHRQKKSLAQPLTREQYETLTKNADALGVLVRSAPEQMTPKVRTLYEKTREKKKTSGQDQLDCEAWIDYLCKTETPSKSCLAKPKQYSDTELDAIYDFKTHTNMVLNWVRCFETDRAKRYKFEPEYVDGFHIKQDFAANLIRDAGLHETDYDSYEWFSDLNEHLKHLSYEHHFELLPALKYKQVYTLAVMIVDPWTGKERSRKDTCKPPAIKWLFRHICGFTPRHRNGGVARSNLMHHGLKHYQTKNLKIGHSSKKWNEYSEQEKQLMATRRREYRAAVKTALKLLRAIHRRDVEPVNICKEIDDMKKEDLTRLQSNTKQGELFV